MITSVTIFYCHNHLPVPLSMFTAFLDYDHPVLLRTISELSTATFHTAFFYITPLKLYHSYLISHFSANTTLSTTVFNCITNRFSHDLLRLPLHPLRLCLHLLVYHFISFTLFSPNLKSQIPISQHSLWLRNAILLSLASYVLITTVTCPGFGLAACCPHPSTLRSVC